MHVARRHARHSQTPRKRSQGAIASAIVAGVGTLELHAQPLCPERVEQVASRRLIEDAATTGPPRRGRRDRAVATGPTHRCATHAKPAGAPRHAYETPRLARPPP